MEINAARISLTNVAELRVAELRFSSIKGSTQRIGYGNPFKIVVIKLPNK